MLRPQVHALDAAPTGQGVGSGTSGDLRYCINQVNTLSMTGQAITINYTANGS